MRNRLIIILSALIILAVCEEAGAQNNFLKNIFRDYSITVSGNYVSSATIMLNPSSSDLVEKSSSVETKGGYGYGVTLKKRIFGDDFYLGISTEYIKIFDDQLVTSLDNGDDIVNVRLSESLEMVPVEFALYFNVPRFANNFNMYLGGGFGFYFGNRTQKMLNMETSTISKSPMFSLNVLFGAEYFLENNFSLNFEMKMRDGVYKVHNQYPTDYVILDNRVFFFDKDLNSKVYLDGLKTSLGITYYF